MTKQFSNYSDLLTFTRASKGHALRPVSYGTELVVNGDFATTDDWGTGAGWSISGGVASHTGATAGYLTQTNVTEVGKIYKISFDITALASGKAILVYNYTGGSSLLSFSTTGSVSGFFVAEDTKLAIRESASAECTIDNVSVKEVTFDESDGTLTLFEHPENVPRVEYDADGNRLGLLVEEQRTNSILNSNDPTQWGTKTTTATQNLTGPDGVFNSGWTLEDTSESTFEQNTQNVAITANTNTHCVSFFIKKDNDESRFPEFQIVMSGNFFVQVNTKTGATYSRTNQNSGTIDVEDYGEWWRVVMTATNGGSATSLLFKIIPAVSSALGNTVSANLTGSIGFYGAQIELNASFPTSYIKTTGSTATRSADVASIPVADFGYNQSAGTVLFNFALDNTTSNKRLFSLNDGGTTERIDGLINSANSAVLFAVDNNSNVVNQSVSGYVDAEFSKVAASYKLNDYGLTIDGETPVSDTSATVPTITTLTIGTGPASAPINGHIKSIKYYPRRLTNAQLVELTS